MGKQPLSVKPAAPNTVFSKSERPNGAASLLNQADPEVGGIPYRSACEVQIDSRFRTCPMVKLGNGYKRGANDNKVDLSEPSPGPGSYKLPGGISTM
jgi:hypothetical protein